MGSKPRTHCDLHIHPKTRIHGPMSYKHPQCLFHPRFPFWLNLNQHYFSLRRLINKFINQLHPHYYMYKCYTYSNPTPLATIASQALSGPASFLADGTLWVARQVAFAPVVLVVDQGQLFAWDVRGILLTVSNSKVLAIPVYKVLTNC